MIIRKSVKGNLSDLPEEKARRDKMSKEKYERNYKQIKLRVSPSDYDRLKLEAEKLNISIPRLISITMLDAQREQFKPKIDMETKAAINKIGVNINQIAKRINMFGENAIMQDVLEIMTELDDKLTDIYFKI